MRRKYKLVLLVSVVGCIAFALYLPRFIHNRNTAAERALIHNLEQIDGAKQQWAITTNSVLVNTNGKP